MRFMNSSNNYANFAMRSIPANAGKKSKPIQTMSQEAVSKPKTKSRALKGTIAKPQLREPGIARNARSTAAGASQGTRDLFKTQGKAGVKAKSTIAGLKQTGRDAVYAGEQMLKKAGRFAKNNKVGVGLAAAGALGAAGYGIARKMRSDKGKKRGNYN